MREAIRWALVISALVHVGVQARRAFSSQRDGRAGGLLGRHGGTLGPWHPADSPSLTGLYLAIIVPLAPWWLWPVFALGLWWAFSWLAFVALGASYALTGAFGR